MDKKIAREISELMLSQSAALDESLQFVQTACSESEFNRYREAVSELLTIMLLDVMNPIYDEHPDLKPAGLSESPPRPKLDM